MNANTTIKNVSEENQEFSSPDDLAQNYIDLTSEELLVEKYESLYSEIYAKALIFRVIFFISAIVLISFAIYISKNSDKWSILEPIVAVISVLVTVGATMFSQAFLKKKSFSIGIDYSDLINSIEDTIVKMKLEQRFKNNQGLRERVEDFYIEISRLTKAKYETAFRYYSYEFYIYAVIGVIIAAFFTFRIF